MKQEKQSRYVVYIRDGRGEAPYSFTKLVAYLEIDFYEQRIPWIGLDFDLPRQIWCWQIDPEKSLTHYDLTLWSGTVHWF